MEFDLLLFCLTSPELLLRLAAYREKQYPKIKLLRHAMAVRFRAKTVTIKHSTVKKEQRDERDQEYCSF